MFAIPTFVDYLLIICNGVRPHGVKQCLDENREHLNETLKVPLITFIGLHHLDTVGFLIENILSFGQGSGRFLFLVVLLSVWRFKGSAWSLHVYAAQSCPYMQIHEH